MLDPFINALSQDILEFYNKKGSLKDKQETLEKDIASLEAIFIGKRDSKSRIKNKTSNELYLDALKLIKDRTYKENISDSDFADLNHALLLLAIAIDQNSDDTKARSLLISLRNKYVKYINKSFISYYKNFCVQDTSNFENEFIERYLEEQEAFTHTDDIEKYKILFKLIYKFCQRDATIDFKDEARIPSSLAAIIWHLFYKNNLSFKDFEYFLDSLDPLSSYHSGRHNSKHKTNSIYVLVQGLSSLITRMKGYIYTKGYDNISHVLSLPESVIYKLASCYIQGTYVKQDVILGSLLMRYAAICGYPQAIIYTNLVFKEVYGIDEGITEFSLVNNFKRAYDLSTSTRTKFDIEEEVKINKKVINIKDFLLLNLLKSVTNFCDYATVNGFEYEDKFLPLRYKLYFKQALDKVVFENKLEFIGPLVRLSQEAGDLYTLFTLDDYVDFISKNKILDINNDSIYTELCSDFLFYLLDKALSKDDTYAKIIALSYYDKYAKGFCKSKIDLMEDLTNEGFSFAAESLSDFFHVQKQYVDDYDFVPDLKPLQLADYKKLKTNTAKYKYLDSHEEYYLDKACTLGSINAIFSKSLRRFDVFKNKDASKVKKNINILNTEDFTYHHFLFIRSIPESYAILPFIIKDKKLANTILSIGAKLGLDKCLSLLNVEKDREVLPSYKIMMDIIEKSKESSFLSWFVAECYNEGVLLPQSKLNAKFFAMQSINILKNQKALSLLLRLNREFYKNDYNTYASSTNLYAHYLSFAIDEVDDIYDNIDNDNTPSKESADLIISLLDALYSSNALYDKILLACFSCTNFAVDILLDIEERAYEEGDEKTLKLLQRVSNAKFHYNSNYILNAYLGLIDYFILSKDTPTDSFIEIERDLSDVKETILEQSRRLVSPWSSTYKDYIGSYKILIPAIHVKYYESLKTLILQDDELKDSPSFLFIKYKLALVSTINPPCTRLASQYIKASYNHNSGLAKLFMFLDLDLLDYKVSLSRKTINKKKIVKNSDSINSGTLTYEIKQ